MRVRKIQEIEIYGLSEQLLAARKASSLSLLEICRQLDITATYWYKLEKGDANTISYELLLKIQEILDLDLDLTLNSDFSDHLFNHSSHKEKTMNLSRLKWIKVVTPASDYKHKWALSPAEIADYQTQYINRNGLTVVPLGFKQQGSEKLEAGDLMILTQHAKVTHIVEVLDDQPYEEGGWFHRYIKIVWWQPDMDWDDLPHREDVLGYNPQIQAGIPYEITKFGFTDRWPGINGMKEFQEYLAKQLTLISEIEASHKKV